MRTESTIVIRARKALATGADIDIHVPKDIESTTFYFRHGRFANSFTEWWKLCKELGIQDIKLSAPKKDIYRDPFGAAFDTDTIVCFWSKGDVSQFRIKDEWSNKKRKVTLFEERFDHDISDVLNAVDNTEDYKRVLHELSELAIKIGYKYFSDAFDTAYNLLDGALTPNHENAPYYLQDLPDRLKTIMLARDYSYVFGGMGSWNDEPCGAADDMGLGNEYNRLTDELILNMRRSLFYVTNTCWERA